MLQRFTLIPIFLLLLCMPLSAQHEMSFSLISTRDGLSDNRIREIVQLQDGRMIVCTIGTTNIFDGTSFKHLHENAVHVSALSGYDGYNKAYADAAYLWIKTQHQVRLIDVKRESFISKPIQILRAIGNGDPVVDFFIDENKHYWIVTSTDKLVYCKPKASEKRVFKSKVSVLNGKTDRLLQVEVHASNVYLLYQSGAMVCYDLNTGKKIHQTDYLNPEEKNKGYQGVKVTNTPFGLYLITNGDAGLLKLFNVRKRSWETMLRTPFELRNLAFDNKHTLFVYGKSGLWAINAKSNQKTFVSGFKLSDGKSIDNEAFALCNDNQGGLWIGTLNQGLLYYHPDRFKFQKIDNHFNLSENGDLDVTCFTNISETETAIGTSKGLFVFNHVTQQVSGFKGAPQYLACQEMLRSDANNIWMTTTDGRLFALKPEFQPLSHTSFKKIKNLTRLKNKVLLTTDRKAAILEGNKIELLSSAMLPDSIHQLIPNSENTWMGISHSGVFQWDMKHQKMSFPKNTILNNNVKPLTCGTIDKQGLVWIGTMDGLLLWNPKTNHARAIYTENGLVNNSIKGILEDKNGDIWVTTAGGICRIQVGHSEKGIHLEFNNFNSYDGVINTEFVAKSVFESSNGLLFFGGINGFNTFDLNNLWKVKKLNTPIFTQLTITGKAVKTGETFNGKIKLPNAIASTDSIHLSYKENFFTIDVSALNYINPSQTYFKYRLEGNNNQWTEFHASNGTGRIGFTNLEPGTYKLVVFAANNSSEWSELPATLTILISPPFWKTTVAYLSYILVLSLIVLFSVKRYKRVTRKRIEDENEAKLNQLKLDFFTNISHEIRTPLTLIVTPLETIIREIQDIHLEQKLQGIWRNAKELLTLVNQLLDFRRNEMLGDPLHLSFGNIAEFMDPFASLFQNLAESKHIEFTVNNSITDLYIYFDKEKMFGIINNLLSNAFKFTPDGGRIELNLTCDGHNINIEVTDTGIGIPSQEISKIFNRFFQVDSSRKGSGIGLHLVHQYVTAHGGKITVESKQNVQTCFRVQIPVNLQPSEKETIDEKREHLLTEQDDLAETNNQHIQKHKVLIVEDNDELRHFMVNELRKHFDVVEASNGVEGETKALSEQPDIIISDVMMPEMDGHELCKRLKSNVLTSHVPILLLTARSTDEHKLKGYESGADEYITKPFRMDFLLLRMHQLIEKQNRLKVLFKKQININPSDIQIGSLDDELILKALNLVEQNISNADYSVAEMSRDMHMDRTVLYRKLQGITGLTPIEFIRSMRLKRAAQILNQGQYPISEVAVMVGFNTQKYFTKYFKEAFGVTPSQYKNNEPL